MMARLLWAMKRWRTRERESEKNGSHINGQWRKCETTSFFLSMCLQNTHKNHQIKFLLLLRCCFFFGGFCFKAFFVSLVFILFYYSISIWCARIFLLIRSIPNCVSHFLMLSLSLSLSLFVMTWRIFFLFGFVLFGVGLLCRKRQSKSSSAVYTLRSLWTGRIELPPIKYHI